MSSQIEAIRSYIAKVIALISLLLWVATILTASEIPALEFRLLNAILRSG